MVNQLIFNQEYIHFTKNVLLNKIFNNDNKKEFYFSLFFFLNIISIFLHFINILLGYINWIF